MRWIWLFLYWSAYVGFWWHGYESGDAQRNGHVRANRVLIQLIRIALFVFHFLQRIVRVEHGARRRPAHGRPHGRHAVLELMRRHGHTANVIVRGQPEQLVCNALGRKVRLAQVKVHHLLVAAVVEARRVLPHNQIVAHVAARRKRVYEANAPARQKNKEFRVEVEKRSRNVDKSKEWSFIAIVLIIIHIIIIFNYYF